MNNTNINASKKTNNALSVSNNTSVKNTEPIVVNEPTKPRDTSNKIPDNSTSETAVSTSSTTVSIPQNNSVTKPVEVAELDEKLYKPNK